MPPAPAAQTVDCKDPQDQTSLNICADRSFQAADKALNATYRALIAKMSPTDRAQLQTAQRAWLTYRDAQCAFETAGSVGGSAHPMVVSGCRQALTQAQTERLEFQLRCPEGDLACGGH